MFARKIDIQNWKQQRMRSSDEEEGGGGPRFSEFFIKHWRRRLFNVWQETINKKKVIKKIVTTSAD